MYERDGRICVPEPTGKFLEGLVELEFAIEIMHFKYLNQEDSSLVNYNIKNKGIRISYVKRRKSKFLSYIFAVPYSLLRLLRNDFLYIFYPNSFYFLIIAAILINKPYGLYVRGEKEINSRRSLFFFKRAKFINTISPMYTELINSCGGKAFTIAPMIFYSVDDIIRDREYNSKSYYHLLFLGRVEIAKGILDLIYAIKALVDDGCLNFHLSIVGEGPHLKTAKDLVKSLELNRNIKFDGPVFDKGDIQKSYQKNDLFILPSHHEGFPRVLYEAMIYGIPIVTTFVGTIPFLMKDKVNCFKINSHEPQDIYLTLKKIINNYEIVGPIAQNATNTVYSYLTKHKKNHVTLVNEQLRRSNKVFK